MGGGGAAFVEIDTVAQSQAYAGGDRVVLCAVRVLGLRLELMLAESIGPEKRISATNDGVSFVF